MAQIHFVVANKSRGAIVVRLIVRQVRNGNFTRVRPLDYTSFTRFEIEFDRKLTVPGVRNRNLSGSGIGERTHTSAC